MPLSDYEQRVLDAMERDLASDSSFAKQMVGSRRHTTLGYAVAALVMAAGVAGLVVGVLISIPWIAIAGFALLFAGAAWAFATKPKAQPGWDGQGSNATASQEPKRKIMDRMESRWDRRQGLGGR